MGNFEKIKEEMKRQKIVPRIRYELMVLRALKVVGAVVIGAVVVWLATR